jgi:hypothetical protein
MPVTIASAESSWMKGREQFLEWRNRIEAQWMRPKARADLALMLASLTDEQRAELEAVAPAVFEELDNA